MASEFNLLLKHIPCPKGDDCTAFRCLFRHKADEEAWPLQGQTQASSATAEPAEADNMENGPRKRAKTKEYDPASPLIASMTPPPLPQQREPAPSPPRKRKLPSAAMPNRTAQLKGTSQTVAPEKLMATVSTPGLVRKAESLNPRHVLKAPATHETRFKLLRLLHGELARLNGRLKKDASAEIELLLSDQEVIWAALDEEERLAVDKPAIYADKLKHRIVAYKRMSAADWKKERIEALEKLRPKAPPEQVPLGPPVCLETGLTTEQELAILRRLYTPINDKAQFGYVPVVPTEKEIQVAREAEEASKGWEVCDRCLTRFCVFPGRREEDGALASGGSCTHHPGRAYFPEKQRGESSLGDRAKRYRCCGQAVGDSPGCITSPTHVFKTSDSKRLALVWNFAETPPNPAAPTDRAVAFDCEMGYTVKGLELIRLTATSWPSGDELLDVLVQPLGEVLDLNSRYSGVWPDDMVNAEPFSPDRKPAPPIDGEPRRLQMVPSPMVARDLLFSLVSPDTPLIGHGLENDLNCVRVVHPTLVDTILLFPHKRGLPIRYGLKVLTENYLNRKIQVEVEGKLTGHDSAEDARAAGDLVLWKVMQEWITMRSRGWDVMDGKLVDPGMGKLTEEFIEARGEGKG